VPAPGAPTAVRVALTFDVEHPDHPAEDPIGNAYRMLDVLGEHAVPATFFVQGAWARAFPRVLRRIVSDGHLVGNHSQHHCRFIDLTDQGMAADLALSRSILEEFVPTGDRFRLPWGAGTDGPEAERIERAVARSGYRHIGWSCDGNDWAPGATPGDVAAPIIAAAREQAGLCVPLLHSWPDPTSEAVRLVIAALRDSATFVRLDQPPAQPPA
jgi:peptidoglycan/xylan/chitin deacetylase (PgdA/CDA1 family)